MTRHELNLLNNHFGLNRFFNSILSDIEGVQTQFTPSCDVREFEDSYLFSFEMPGVKKEDLNIELKDNTLTVSGERKLNRQDTESELRYSEHRYGKFYRSITLPTHADTGGLEASYENGLLQIALPKVEKAKPRQVQIGDKLGARFMKQLDS